LNFELLTDHVVHLYGNYWKDFYIFIYNEFRWEERTLQIDISGTTEPINFVFVPKFSEKEIFLILESVFEFSGS